MNGIVHDAEEIRRLTLALLLALGLHTALLFGIPAKEWSLRYPRSLRLDVALLPPVNQPHIPAAPAAPEPVATATQSAPSPAVVSPEPVLPPVESPPAAPPVPAPVLTPTPASIPPPKPVAVARSAPKPATPAVQPVTPVKPPAVAKTTPDPRVVVKPVVSPSPAKPAALPVKPATPAPKTATAEPVAKPPIAKPAPAPRPTPAETPPPVEKSRTNPIARPGRGGVGGSRLDSTALLGQIAGLDTETQRRANGSVREQRVSLADTRSLAGFYAADWARKVTRVGEMNFPDAARRLNLSAGPLLGVAIRADGSLRDVRVLRSSGNAELDQAARRIVQLAAPYPPFPPELRQQAEVLRIEAPWRFDPGGRVQVR